MLTTKIVITDYMYLEFWSEVSNWSQFIYCLAREIIHIYKSKYVWCLPHNTVGPKGCDCEEGIELENAYIIYDRFSILYRLASKINYIFT